jgi:hypothetical protein
MPTTGRMGGVARLRRMAVVAGAATERGASVANGSLRSKVPRCVF